MHVFRGQLYFLNACRFLILFDIHLVTLFSLEQNNFFLEHKLPPVHLTWLHLVALFTDTNVTGWSVMRSI